MPNPIISKSFATEIITLIEQCLTEGFKRKGPPSAVMECGRRLRPSKRINTYHLDRIKELYSLTVDWSLYRPREDVTPSKPQSPTIEIVVKPVYRITAPTQDAGAKTYICAIGDAHDGPAISNKDRFRWAGKHIKAQQHDCVVQIGDFISLESVSRFTIPGTLAHKEAPYWKDDMASMKLALSAFHEGLDDYDVPKHCTLGNHEDRYTSQLKRQPWAIDALEVTPHILLTEYGWEYSPYGAFHFVGQTAFTHVPLNRMGKPFGGKFAENQIGNEATFDLVYGHSHRPLIKPFPKLNDVIIKVVNLGCFLPQGHVEPYAQHTLHGWEWGLFDITLLGGKISKADWIPMLELEERYG